MPEETPTEITKNEQAKWSGIVAGVIGGSVSGILANWQNIVKVVFLAAALYGGIKVYIRQQADEAQLKAAWDHIADKEKKIEDLQVATFGEVPTNQPTKTP